VSRIVVKARTEMSEKRENLYMRRSKRLAVIDRSSTCFKGKGSISKSALSRSFQFIEKRNKEPYI